MANYPDVLSFIFHGWAFGFAFAVSLFYASKVFFAPKGVWRFWSGPS